MTDTWDKRPDGNIAVCPVTGWSSAVFAGMAVGLRLEFAPDEAALESGSTQAVQLVLTPAQATELAQVLQRAAGVAVRPGAGPAS